jgi:hypothetical protein
MMVTDGVDLRCQSPVIITANVTDDYGDHWVCFVRSLGWSCDTCDDSRCVHVLSVMQTTKGNRP